ncbi:unnamed protein product [Cochlearia groenlandica]
MANIDIITIKEPLITTNNNQETKKIFNRCVSHQQDELKSFRKYLKYMCVDQSSPLTTILSWTMFIVFTIIVPMTSHFLLACDDCDSYHSRPYDSVVQLSLSSVAALSFLCLTRFVSKYGLRRFLFFDKLCDESQTVRRNYTNQLNTSLHIVSYFVIPCFLTMSAYKTWWYASGGSQIPFLGHVILSDTVACVMELCSWLYRTTVIFLVCVLFRLICHLQILRLQDFAKLFKIDSDVETILSEHLRIKRYLRIISHRFRFFILCLLVFVTGSQFSSLLITTKAYNEVNIYRAGELALCSMTLVTALLILLRSASKITHKAQAVTCLAAKWHVCATLETFETTDGETPTLVSRNNNKGNNDIITLTESDSEDFGDEDDLDNDNIIPAYAFSTISFQKRQALVSYFENNIAGITVYGFTLDRGTLHTIFGLELSLVLWLLGKTIGIS